MISDSALSQNAQNEKMIFIHFNIKKRISVRAKSLN